MSLLAVSLLCAILCALRARNRGHDLWTFGWAGLWLGPGGYLLARTLTREARPRLRTPGLRLLLQEAEHSGRMGIFVRSPLADAGRDFEVGGTAQVGSSLTRWLQWRLDCWAAETTLTRLLLANLSLAVVWAPPLLQRCVGWSFELPWTDELALAVLKFPQVGWLFGLLAAALAWLGRFSDTDSAHFLHSLELTVACGYPWDQAQLMAGCLVPESTRKRLARRGPVDLASDHLVTLADEARANVSCLFWAWVFTLKAVLVSFQRRCCYADLG